GGVAPRQERQRPPPQPPHRRPHGGPRRRPDGVHPADHRHGPGGGDPDRFGHRRPDRQHRQLPVVQLGRQLHHRHRQRPLLPGQGRRRGLHPRGGGHRQERQRRHHQRHQRRHHQGDRHHPGL